jgi:hypothetical protein
MVTLRHLDVLRAVGIGPTVADVSEWLEYLSWASAVGVIRIGKENTALLDAVSLAWTSHPYVDASSAGYTLGNKLLPWQSADDLSDSDATVFHRIPVGHPLKVDYEDGLPVRVSALSEPEGYFFDATDLFLQFFPSGIAREVTALYAVLSVSVEGWARVTYRLGQLFSGMSGFVPGVDSLVLVAVDGMPLETFMAQGIFGVLTRPLSILSGTFDSVMESLGSARCIIVADGKATYSLRAQFGEMVNILVMPGHGVSDVAVIELDSGDSVSCADLLALRGLSEGDEIVYVCGEMVHLLSDIYGNEIIGSYVPVFSAA